MSQSSSATPIGECRVAEKRRMQGCCIDCGRKYGDEHGFPDLVVPNDAWKALSPTGHEGGLLCPSCMCRRAHDAGVRCLARFTSGPFVHASESAPPTDLALEYAERKGFIEGCTEGYPGIAHDLETMRAALVAVSESHVSAYGKDRGICYVRPDTLEKVRDAIKNAAPQETQQADRLRTNRLKDRDESGPGESPAVAAPSSPSSAKHAAPQAGTPEEPSGRASASQDPVRDTEPAGAASCSTANSATQASTVPCARCGGVCVEFTVPNDVWNTVVRLGGKEGDDEYICEACYRKAVESWVRTVSAIPARSDPTTPADIEKRTGELRVEIECLAWKITGDPLGGVTFPASTQSGSDD